MGQLFDKLVTLYRLVTPDERGEADVHLSDAETLSLLRDLLHKDRDPDDTGLTILQGDPDQLILGETIRLGFQQPLLHEGLLLRDLDALVSAGQLREPEHYYLWNPPRAKGDPSEPGEVEHYREVLALILLLKKAAAYLDESTQELVFVQNERFSVPVRYASTDITEMVAAASKTLLTLFDDKLHRDQKLAMLAIAVQGITSRVEPRNRFVELLHHLDDVTHAVTESYRLFCSNFSYEKIKSDIQDAHIEFAAKIHKTFSDIQNQLLAIPVATVIVATQMKEADSFGGQFWINTGVLLGSAIFVVLFWLLVINQEHTLTVLGDEINRRQDKIAKDHADIADLLTTTFRKLRGRIATQKSVITTVRVIVVIGFVATVLVYGLLLRLP